MYGRPAGAAARLWWALHRPRGPLLLFTTMLASLAWLDAAEWWLHLALGGIVLTGFTDETPAGTFGLSRRDALVGDLLGLATGALVASVYACLLALLGGRVLTHGADADAWGSWARTAMIVIGLITAGCAILWMYTVRQLGRDHATGMQPVLHVTGRSSRRTAGSNRWEELWPDTVQDRAVRAPMAGTILGSWLLLVALLAVVAVVRIPFPQLDLAAAISAMFAMTLVALTTGALSMGGSFATWVALQGSRARWVRLAVPVVLLSGASVGVLALLPIGLDLAVSAAAGHEPMASGIQVWVLVLALAGVGMLIALLAVVSALYLDDSMRRSLVFYASTSVVIALLAVLVVGAYATFGMATGLAVQFRALAVLLPALWLTVRRLARRAVPSDVRVPTVVSR